MVYILHDMCFKLGSSYGLSLLLNIEEYEQVPDLVFISGVKVHRNNCISAVCYN